MAGDWMKVEHCTPDKPEVLAIASAMRISPDEAFGICFRMWRWFDQHTKEGNAPSVTTALLNRLLGVTGFAEAALAEGWLELCEIDGKPSLRLPNFARHTGQTSKQRALTAKRVATHKTKSNAKGNAHSVSEALPNALPREEKRREESKDPLPPKTRKAKAGKPDDYSPEFVRFWNVYPAIRKTKKAPTWKAWQTAILSEHPETIITAAAEFADSPMGKGEFCPGPEPWLNQCRWDDDRGAWQVGDGKTKAAPASRLMTDEEYESWTPYGDGTT